MQRNQNFKHLTSPPLGQNFEYEGLYALVSIYDSIAQVSRVKELGITQFTINYILHYYSKTKKHSHVFLNQFFFTILYSIASPPHYMYLGITP